MSVTLGLRLEYELGPTERFNRAIGSFDPNATLPISAAAQAAYARSPVPELPSSQFIVKGGSLYPGEDSRRLWRNEFNWLPRVGAAWQVSPQTVIRGGYGLFFDTLNVLNSVPDQTGFSRRTSSIPTNDFGVNWLIGDPRRGISPLTDPFPVRADGTRFDEPVHDALGLMARAGQGWTFTDYNVRHARQQRWRVGVQRQIGVNLLVDAAYTGSYSDRIPISQSLSPLPEVFWASGQTRDNAVANNLNANVPNPFLLANFADLKSSNPLVYQALSTQSFFTQTTIRKNLLLRPFPQMNGLTDSTVSLGKARTDAFELTIQRRFSKGFNLNFGYTGLRGREATSFYNEFDPTPTWVASNQGRPHRVAATGIYEMPFGRGRAFARSGVWNHLLGGFQVAATFEWQPGPLLTWPNLFFTGDINAIGTGSRNLDRWFNTDGFVKSTALQPAAFQTRVFPVRVDGVRADGLNQWNGNLQREIKLAEGVTLNLRFEALNCANRTQFAAPSTDPSSTNFGRVTAETLNRKRWIQLLVRLRF